VRYPAVVKGLATAGRNGDRRDVVAFDEDGRPSFNAMQNYRCAPGPVVYYVFDLMMLGGGDLRVNAWRTVARCARAEGVAEARGTSPLHPTAARAAAGAHRVGERART
jgi:ATP-dependent DNA ligase